MLKAPKLTNSYLNKMRFNLLGQQMTLNADHDVVEVRKGNEPRPILVKSAKGLDGIFLVEVVQKLTELGIVDASFLILTEVQVIEATLHVKGYSLVKLRLLHEVHKFI